MQEMFNSSLLSSTDEKLVDYTKHKYDNPYLRAGVVLRHYPIGHEKNKSNQFDEYEVNCVEQSGNKGITHRTYMGCVSATSFGSAKDFCYFKYTQSSETTSILNGQTQSTQKPTPEGSIVLLLMIDGFSESPVIIGAMPHPDSPQPLEGHSMYFQYNDLKATIADDGGFGLEFLKSNTKFTVNKDGDMSIFIKDGFQLDLVKKDGKFALTVPELIDVKTKKVSLDAQEEVNAKIAKLMIEGKESALKIDQISIDGKKFEVKAKQMQFDGKQFKVNGSNVEIKGKIVKLSGSLINLGEGGLPALNMLSKTFGVGNLGAPVVSSVFSGFSSTVFIAS